MERAAPGETNVDRVAMRKAIETQTCPWCGRGGLRSLANHTVVAHGVYAHELRELAGLAPGVPLCSPELSDCHRELARESDAVQQLRRPEVQRAAAATREANYDDAQRTRRAQHLHTIRPAAVDAMRRSIQAEERDPALAAARRSARSRARRAFRAGVECPICGAWFCSYVPVGEDYRQRMFCGDDCYREGMRRLRTRTWMQSRLDHLANSNGARP